ncbi:adenylate kinase, chloroplastic isoform X2 [Capsicum annuum]|uniref:adenylate kinase, chloroplastic isoform X2 n=1 Tax=Capsicum annuum TaxID=4072 RepID=UPI0007BF1307|nr:adenylate kinase, chloroplastic isoform X2 [Capsicum annuum]
MALCCSLSFPTVSTKPNKSSSSPICSSLQLTFTAHLPFSKSSSFYPNNTLLQTQCRGNPSTNGPSFLVVGSAKKQEPLRVMISGAPASGKGTQCELITKKYDLVHVAAGDLLRAEIAAGTENGRRAKEYMDKGQLVPNEIVVTVPEEILVERVVGRRLDPVTGRIYHLKYSPPETDEIAARLTQRFDDTEEKVKLRLHTHHQNVESVLSMYKDITFQVDGSVSKEEVFAQIDGALTQLLESKQRRFGTVMS